MLLLLLRAADDLYAVPAGRVVEVVPRVPLRTLPHAPEYVAGLFSYRGRVVPVIDLGLLLGRRAGRPWLSTRIVVVELAARGEGGPLLGLAAEQVSDVTRFDDARVVSPPMSIEEAPYLGAVVRGDEGLLQVIEVDRLLTGALRDALMGSETEAP